MANSVEDIQETFKSYNKNVFPNEKDYVASYNVFVDFLENEVHRNINPMMSVGNPDLCLNDHGIKHVKMVIKRASSILSEFSENKPLTEYELFLLLVAIQIHDTGHIVGLSRDTHPKDTSKIIQKLDTTISSPERKKIFDIARAHSGKDDPLRKLPDNDYLSGEKIRPRLLAAILRMADELSEEHSRASNFQLELGNIPQESLIYHQYSSCLDSLVIDMSAHEVNTIFYLNEEHVSKSYELTEKITGTDEDISKCKYLIDEIYSRTLKTFNEALYYNKFVSSELQINTLNVTINFLKKNTDDFADVNFLKPIKYRLEEKGYPNFHSKNIFEICEDDLIDSDGKQKNGEYLLGKLNNAQV